jgi:hypothetical protein
MTQATTDKRMAILEAIIADLSRRRGEGTAAVSDPLDESFTPMVRRCRAHRGDAPK